MNYLPKPYLNINFKPVINNNYANWIYNTKDNLKIMLKEIEKGIITNQLQEYFFILFNGNIIKDYPVGFDNEKIYLKNNIIKLSEIQKIRLRLNN